MSASSVNLTAITGWGGVLALISNTTTVQFNNVQFIANYASRGSSLYIVSNSSVSIQNCYFFGNNATQGAMYLIDTPFVNITDSQFINNRANQSGGAIWASGTTFSFINTDFIGNAAPQGAGGAVIFSGNSEVVFQTCNFRNNTANNDGGAVYSNSGAYLEVYDCLFDYNRGGQGGAVSVNTFGGLDCYDSVFTNNVAGSWGGAMYIEQANTNFHNTSVRFNYAGQGGGAASLWSEAKATLLGANFTENNSPRGGAFFLQYGSILQVTNSFIEYNTADENGGGIYCSDSEIYLNESTALDNNVASSDASTDIYCAEDIPYTYCKVYGVTNFTDYCSMPDEGDAGTKQYNSLIIIGAVLVGSSFLIGCGSFVIYFLDPSHRKQQGFYWSAFKEDDIEDNDAIPLPE